LLDRVLHLITLFCLVTRNVLFVLDDHPAPCEDTGVLLTVAEVEPDTRWILCHGFGLLWSFFLSVVLGANELSRVAQTLTAVGEVEWRGVTVEGRLSITGFLLDLLKVSTL